MNKIARLTAAFAMLAQPAVANDSAEPHEHPVTQDRSSVILEQEDSLAREVLAIRASTFSSDKTMNFEALEQTFHLDKLRKSVGYTQADIQVQRTDPTSGTVQTGIARTTGSVVLLPNDQIAVSSHVVHSKVFDVTFYPMNEKGISTQARVIFFDKQHDFAIAQIVESGFTRKNSLLPVERAETNYDQPTQSDAENVTVGFFDRKIHAVTGTTTEFIPNASAPDMEPVACQVGSITDLHVWEGMSGGGKFNKKTGEWAGILTGDVLDSQGKITVMHTPADLIWAAVDHLNGVTPSFAEEPCRVDPKNIVREKTPSP